MMHTDLRTPAHSTGFFIHVDGIRATAGMTKNMAALRMNGYTQNNPGSKITVCTRSGKTVLAA